MIIWCIEKFQKERKRNAKRNARSYFEKGTEQERVPDYLKRNAGGTRSRNLRNDQCLGNEEGTRVPQ